MGEASQVNPSFPTPHMEPISAMNTISGLHATGRLKSVKGEVVGLPTRSRPMRSTFWSIAALLAGGFFAPSLAGADNAAVLGFEDIKPWKGLVADPNEAKEGIQCAIWADTKVNSRVRLTDLSLDLSGSDRMSFWLQSPSATGAKIVVVLGADNPETEGDDYYRDTITLDWEGWRQVEIPFARLKQTREPKGFGKITSIIFASSSYGIGEPEVTTTLKLDGISFPAVAPAGAATSLSLDAATAAMLAFENVEPWRGLVPDTEEPHGGTYSGKWMDTPTTDRVRNRNFPKDLSGVASVNMWVHSAVANGAKIGFILHSDDAATPEKDYYAHTFVVDWSGWKELSIPLADMRAVRAPAGFQAIQDVYFVASGYGVGEAKADTVLKFDDMRLIVKK